MKKYFIAETDEELVFGDTLELDLTKKTKHGLHTIEGAIKFSEMSLPLLLEIGAMPNFSYISLPTFVLRS